MMKKTSAVTISLLAALILLGISKVIPVTGQIPYFPISDIPWNKNVPDAACNASADQFLVVWEDFRGSGVGTDVYAQLVNSDGSLSGVNFPVTETEDWQRGPKSAYSPVADKYLVVWEDWRNDDIYGRLVNANGTLSGSEFPIAAAANYQWNPDPAYNSTTNQFLVVFNDDRVVSSDHDIYGKLVNADGSLPGADLQISTASNDQLLPAVAYNSTANQYLVVWQDDRNTATDADIYARVVNGSGAMVGADFSISTASPDQSDPDVAYAPSANRFLVVWEQSADIYARLVNADKTFPGPEFRIASSSGTLSDPAVAYDPHSEQFLVVWSDSYGWDTVYGQPLGVDGSLAGPTFHLGYGLGNDWTPAVASNSSSNQFLVVWEHQICKDSFCEDWDWAIAGAFYQATAHFEVYLPIVLRDYDPSQLPTATPTPTSTATPTSTPTPTPTATPTNTPTPTPTSTPDAWDIILSEDFEGSFPGVWQVLDGEAGYGQYYWGKRTCRAYGGDYSGWAVGGGTEGSSLTCGSNYPDNAKSWMIYGPFSLADATDAELSFKAWVNTESPTTMYDDFSWMASIDGNSFKGYRTWGDSSGWVDIVLDLSAIPDLGDLTGQPSVWVGLYFYSDASTVYPEGVYVDDIILRKCTTGNCSTSTSSLHDSDIPGLYRLPAVRSIKLP